MYNILYFDVCALILLGIMFLSNTTRRLIRGRTNRFFLCIIVLGFLASVGDIVSGFGSNVFTGEGYQRAIMQSANYLYFFTHNNIPAVYALYCMASMGVWHICMKDKKVVLGLIFPSICQNLLFISNMITKHVFYISADASYCRGNLLWLCYVCTFVILAVGIAIICRYGQYVKPYKKWIMLSMFPINLIGVAIQYFYPYILIENFFLSVEVVVFSLVLHRSEEYKDPMSGAKKYNTGIDYLRGMLNTEAPFSVLFFNIINSKNLQMYMGQNQYAEYLRYVSATMNELCNKYKIDAQVYFLEGGLFAIMAEEKNTIYLGDVAQELRTLFFEKLVTGEYEVLADVRIVIVDCPTDISDYETLLTFSQTFQNTMPDTRDVLYYRDFSNDREFIQKNELGLIIKRGLEEGNFEMHYQPIYSTVEKRFVAAEALIRLKDDEYGNISPALFIPAAENSGDMHDIGNFVFEEVTRYYAKENLKQYGIDYIQINLSPSQCIEVDLISKIKKCIKKNNLEPENVMLELTELAADIDPKVVDTNVGELSEYGIRFALDDYGSGYSNIKRVTELPIEMVKLDRSLVTNLKEKGMQIIVEDTILMLQEMGKEVLVSGIEEEETAKHFADMGIDYIQGCEYMQGFYFCEPVPGDEFVDFLRKNIGTIDKKGN